MSTYTDFVSKTNDEYAAWCKTVYAPEALDARGMKSLHGLWAWQEQERRMAALRGAPETPTFANGTLVRKRSGSQWEGHIVGRYSTGLTPDGYAVESITHAGSVQIYPAHALELVNRDCGEAGCAEGRCGTASCLKGGS